jgi:DNA topoisomerase-1
MITGQVPPDQVSALQNATFIVVDKQEQTVEESAPEPYTTATLLQDAITQYGMSSSQVMQAVQWLFENGLITYPRTDSISVAPEPSDEARKIVSQLFGIQSLDHRKRWNLMATPEAGAHEAIRPTSCARLPNQLSGDMEADCLRLYSLIHSRFLAGYMCSAVYHLITVELESDEDQGE